MGDYSIDRQFSIDLIKMDIYKTQKLHLNKDMEFKCHDWTDFALKNRDKQ